MPIDTRAPLAALGSAPPPLDILGMANQASMLHARQAEIAEQERKRRDEMEVRGIWQEVEGDPERAVDAFRKRGFGGLAQKLETDILDARAKRTTEIKNYLDNQKSTFEIIRGVTGAITSPGTHRIALDMARKVAPEMVPLIGEEYNEANTAALQQWGLDQVARVDFETKTLDALSKGVKTPQEAIGLAANILKTAQTPDQYQTYLSALQELMPGPLRGQVLGMFQQNYSPEAVAQASALANADAEQKGGTSDYAQFLKRYAASIGKTRETLTAEDELKARKQYGQADDAARRPFAPIVIQTPQGPMVTTGDSRQNVVPVIGPGGQPVANKLPAAMIEKVAGLENADEILNDLTNTMKPEWIGPAAGRLNELNLKIPGTSVPEGFGRFYAQSNTLKNMVVKAITGAQMSEPEAKRILGQVPVITDKPDVWAEKLKATQENLGSMSQKILQLSGAQQRGGAPKTKGPAIGERRKFGDKIGVWDGKGWKVEGS